MRLAAGLCCLILLGFAAYRSLRLGYADIHVQPRVAALERAVALDPDNAQFRALLAETLEQEGGDGAPAMEAAVALNPWDALARIRLGLMQEAAGDLGRAEQSLLAAAGFNRQYAPSWALANFYFRRRDEARFWPWARRAFLMAYDDCTPLFRLCWNVTADSDRILKTAIPDRRNVLAQYLAFLLDQNQIAGGQAAAQRLIPLAESKDTDVLLRYCERAMSAGLAAVLGGRLEPYVRAASCSFRPARARARPFAHESLPSPPVPGTKFRLAGERPRRSVRVCAGRRWRLESCLLGPAAGGIRNPDPVHAGGSRPEVPRTVRIPNRGYRARQRPGLAGCAGFRERRNRPGTPRRSPARSGAGNNSSSRQRPPNRLCAWCFNTAAPRAQRAAKDGCCCAASSAAWPNRLCAWFHRLRHPSPH